MVIRTSTILFLLASVISEKDFKPQNPINDNKILIFTPQIQEENLLFDKEERAIEETSGSFVEGQGKGKILNLLFFTPQALPEVLAQQVSWRHPETHSEFKA